MTSSRGLTLEILPNSLAVCRLAPTESIPAWATHGSFFSVSKTPEELSIVCDEANVPSDIKRANNWQSLKVKGPLDFALTGILASLAIPLAQAGISIFAVSTFDTDYILVKKKDLAAAVSALSLAGHRFEKPGT